MFGIDFFDVFSPVASYECIRICLALAAIFDFEVIDMLDYIAAFIQAVLEEDVYVEQPDGWKDGTDHVLKLNKALEGLHQIGKAWYDTLVATLKDLDFKKVVSLPSCHIYAKDGIMVIVPIYVDDKLLLCNNRVLADELIAKL